MNEREFYELGEKKDRAEKRAQWLSNLQLGSSAVGVLCWIAGFFFFNRQPGWLLSCLVFAVTSFVLGFVTSHFRKTVKKIYEEMKPLRGGSGSGRTRYSITPTISKEMEE